MKPDFIKVLGLEPKRVLVLKGGRVDDDLDAIPVKDLQAKLEEKCKVIYADDSATLSSTFWTTEKQPSDKHQAFIFGVTEIVKKECKHEPIQWFRGKNDTPSATYEHKCKHCGEKLKPVAWEVKG